MFGMKTRGQREPERDLGFGSALASDSGARLLNQDGSQTVHARSSYTAEEILWGSKFSDLYLREGEHIVGIDLGRLSDFEKAVT